MNKWRPEGWEPITGPRHQELYDYKGDVAYEMGADAMLETVRKQIERVDLPQYKKSWNIMTPEDTRQKILDHLSSNNDYD